MALTKKDLEKIKDVVNEVVEPQFKAVRKEFKEVVAQETSPYFTAIKTDFNRIEKRLDGIDQRMESFVTKDYLDQKLDEKLDEKLRPLRKEILAGQDKISKQLTDLQTENTMGTEIYKRHDQKLEEHETRIVQLEVKV